MKKEVEVAIIGAGSAGLYALSQVRKETSNFLVINDGPYGTTCARVGCMPSKSLIRIAEYYHEREYFDKSGIQNSDKLSISMPDVLKRVRKHRDILVDGNIKNVTRLGDKVLSGKAEFVNANTLKVGEDEIIAKKIIIATGSKPVFDPKWEEFKEYILTTDELFEQEDLPSTLGVLGLGVIGLELGQALSKLGIKITAVHSKEFIGGLTDPEVNKNMLEVCEKEFDIWLGGGRAVLTKVEDKINIKNDKNEVLVDKVLVAIGRKPNLTSLKLENLGINLDKRGMPKFDPQTMQIEDLPIYIAGDVNADRPLLHEAADEGRIAGYNAVKSQKKFKRKVPLAIVFTDPNIALIGKGYNDIKDDENVMICSYNFKQQGRAFLMNKNVGLANLYIQKSDGKLLGAQIAAPAGEHLAHHLAWAMEQELTVYDMLELPFYHPTLEEGLSSLLLICAKKLGLRKDKIVEIPFV
ncbi:dihydrolipoyl dehydrogenase [Sulfurovum sp.]|uniref:dihydrolipoyl dehydrogenase n=1 Tax=Sulfurovum sp. TaxID=1969726 RepID=UPI00286803EC|nr:dihydrolipoyl dehydrogenase [Sulfurovum sp.]